MSSIRKEISISSGEETAIDLYSTIMDVVKEWLSILLLTVAAGLTAFVVLSNLRPLDYATSATMVVRNMDEENKNGNTGTDVYENLNYGADSASRLKNILESKELKDTVAKELGLKSFEGKTSAQTLGESNLLEITVRAKSPYISYKEAESILNNYTRFSGDLVGGTELTVLERPKVQEKPEHPLENVKYSFLFAGLVFLVICVLLALRSFMRDTVHNSAEVESKIDAKLLATIMHEEKHRRGKRRIGGEKASILITDPVTSFRYTEDMRKLAARILNEMTEKNQKVLLISSAMENEGKSTVSANIALAMSQINPKVVLVDMDFRKPSMYKILNLQDAKFADLGENIEKRNNSNAGGFSEEVKSMLYRVPGTDLTCVLCRKSVPQAVEKYSDQLRRILEEIKKGADFIIIDTAPISLVSDAEELATMADTSVIVIRQHWVEAKEINDTIDALGGRDHVLGCVFNNARKGNVGGATSEYGYGYGGHYAK